MTDNQTTSPAASAARRAAWRELCQMDDPGAGEAGMEDRRENAQASRLVRGVLRHRALLDALLERAALFDFKKTSPAVLWVLRLAAFERIYQSSAPDYAIGAQAVNLARVAGGARAAGFVNAVIRRLLPQLPSSPEALTEDPFVWQLPVATRYSLPEPILAALATGYGTENMEAIARAMAEEEAPVWLRVNTLRATPERLIEELTGEECLVEAAPDAPSEALRWTGGRLPWQTAAWERGELTVQDLAAMLAVRLLAPEAGMAVADFCAAPGGKTGHLWERMGGRGRLVALEVNPHRRAELVRVLERLYGPDHGIVVGDSQSADVAQAGAFDRVLLDAPCQAFGLIRRHPEIRWDRRITQQKAIQATQRQILDQGAALVRPGGRLLWVTCSPTVAENELIVGPWLAAHPEWRRANPLGAGENPGEWHKYLQISKQPIIRTRPDRAPCDGFAYAMIERGE